MSKDPKIRPRGKYVFIKVDKEESRVSKSGLITPANVEQERKSFGTVLGVGDQIKDIKKGDRVLFGTYSGDPLIAEGNNYKFLLDEDILGFL